MIKNIKELKNKIIELVQKNNIIIIYKKKNINYNLVKNGEDVGMKKTKKEKKRLFVISTVIILLIVSLISSVAGDWTKIMENKSKITSLNKKYNDLLSDEEKLVSEVTKLQDDEYILRYAKEKFMYSENGEIIIRMN